MIILQKIEEIKNYNESKDKFYMPLILVGITFVSLAISFIKS